MTTERGLLAAVCLFCLLCPGGSSASDDAVPLSPDQVRDRWHSRLDGHHFVAQIRMQMNLGGLLEERRLVVYRDDEAETHERVLIRFEAPADLRNVGLLYLEQPDRGNDYFLYQPALRRVRRMHESIARTDVYGIDLEFIGFGAAEGEPTVIESMQQVLLDRRVVYRLTERAREPNPRFERRITWIDPETFIPLRSELIQAGETVLIAETLEIRWVQQIPTPTQMHFLAPLDDREVTLFVDHVDYERAMPDDYFSALALMKSRLRRYAHSPRDPWRTTTRSP